MKTMVVDCGREFLMGVVARVLMEEPGQAEDLFSRVRIPTQLGRRRLHLAGGPGMGPEPAEVMAEEPERWDGLS